MKKLNKKAAKACMTIFGDLTDFEIDSMPESIIRAWKTGKKIASLKPVRIVAQKVADPEKLRLNTSEEQVSFWRCPECGDIKKSKEEAKRCELNDIKGLEEVSPSFPPNEYVIMYGSIPDGIQGVVGPYESYDEAEAVMEQYNFGHYPKWIEEIEHPFNYPRARPSIANKYFDALPPDEEGYGQ